MTESHAPSASAIEWLARPLYGAGPVVAVGRFYGKYATFSGRASRSEYWWVALYLGLLYTVVLGLALFVGNASGTVDSLGRLQPGAAFLPFALLFMIVAFGNAVPSIAITVRRLHDADYSGWLYLINFVPYLGSIVLVVLNLMPAKPGGARYDG
jgi:uncharacterized membrane protein YhaH (DUF805 family)